MRHVLALVLTALVTLLSVTSAASASSSSRCRTEGGTVAANAYVRVYAHGSHGLDLWTCAYASRTWRPIGLGQRGSVKSRRGIVDVKVAGRFVGLRVLDSGCSRGECAGPLVEVYDPLNKRQSPDVPGDSYVLRSDGAFAAATATGVVFRDRRGTTAAATGPGIDPGTLALGGRDVYWMQDGAPRTAVLQDGSG